MFNNLSKGFPLIINLVRPLLYSKIAISNSQERVRNSKLKDNVGKHIRRFFYKLVTENKQFWYDTKIIILALKIAHFGFKQIIE